MTDGTSQRTTRVVVVEDEALIAEEIHDRLVRLGYQVVGRADTAQLAIDVATEASPDLVLMDIRLKGEMDGIAAAGLLRDRLGVPVVYLTAHSDKATLERARSTAPFGYVIKPFQERDLLVAVEMALQRHRVEQRLRESEARYATTLASIGDGVIATDLSGHVTFMNRVAEHLTGWSRSDAEGASIDDVLVLEHEADGSAMSNPVRHVLGTRAPSHLSAPALLVDRRGARLHVEDSAAPILDDKGAVCGAVVAFRDGRPRRAAEERLRRVEDQLRHAQRLEAIARFASAVTHDFNNIVTAILGHGELLLDSEMLDPRLRTRVEEIRRAGERAAELTRKLLAYTRGQALAPEVVDLNVLVAEMESLLRRLIGADVTLRIRTADRALPVRVDCGQIEQVLMNLVINARDAMPDGGILTIETRALEVPAGGGDATGGLPFGSWAQLVVADTGVGMSDATRSRLFEPFFTTKPPGVGTGLGLAIVYGIVTQSEGHIDVDTTPGCGCTFTVSLPRSAARPAGRDAHDESATVPRGSESILLVEDEDSVRTIAKLVLESLGYSVLAVAGPHDALRAAEQPIDLLVTDVIMPEMNGCALAEQIAARRPGLKALFLSGYPDDVIRARRPGGLEFAFLQKPFTRTGIARTVRELIDRSDRGSG